MREDARRELDIDIVGMTKHRSPGLMMGENVWVGSDGNRYSYDGTLINHLSDYYETESDCPKEFRHLYAPAKSLAP